MTYEEFKAAVEDTGRYDVTEDEYAVFVTNINLSEWSIRISKTKEESLAFIDFTCGIDDIDLIRAVLELAETPLLEREEDIMINFDYLMEKVLEWAEDKDLLHEENADKQFMKFIEEVFEFKSEMDYLCKIGQDPAETYSDYEQIETQENMILEMGDIFVTLIILCEQLNISPTYCLSMAYDKIKKRKGETRDGIFVKEEDL